MALSKAWILAVVACAACNGASAEKYDQVEIGMAREDVVAIMGDPGFEFSRDATNQVTCWDKWNGGRACVSFGPDNRVNGLAKNGL